MKKLAVSRRSVLRNAAAVATIAALGIKPEHVLGAESGALRVRQVSDIQVLDPGYIIGNAEVSILYACMPRLAVPTRDAEGTWTWQPSDYVEALSQTDPLYISFALKPGLMWSDGAGELTADDVKFSFERMLKSDWSLRWPTLDHVDVTDKHRGVIVLKSPFVATWLLGLASESGSLVPKTLVEKLKDGKFTTQLPAQLGPYRMTEWTPKRKVVLKADDSWRGTRPAFEEVHFIDIEDTNAAELAVEVGEVDLASISPAAAARYKKAPPAGAKLVALPGHQFTWLGMNTQNPKLQDIRVRKAIQRAIDVESILAGAYSGVSPLAHGVIHIGVLGHRTTTNYDYNPEQAKALLKEAGVSGLSLDIKTLSGQGEQLAAAQIIQANLGEIGISATVSPVDSGVFWNLGLESKGDAWKTLELWIMRFGSAPDPADAIQWFTKSQIGIWNWERWSDPAFEALWQAGLAEADAAKRSEIYIKMQDIMEGTGAYVWLTFDPKFYGCKTSVNPAFDPGNDVRVELCRM